jgi:ribosomal subunit interface protein
LSKRRKSGKTQLFSDIKKKEKNMQLTVQGKQIDVGDALREHVASKLEEINSKYFNHATDAAVTFSKEGHGHGVIKALIQIRVGKNIMVIADNTDPDPYTAFDRTADKVAKQLRRYKKKLRDHHDRSLKVPEEEIIKARDYTLAETPEENEENVPEGDDPVVIAEITTDIQVMSVSDAVMRMDLSGQSALLFKNAKHKGLNMVYKRPDGNIGWIDPEESENQESRISA